MKQHNGFFLILCFTLVFTICAQAIWVIAEHTDLLSSHSLYAAHTHNGDCPDGAGANTHCSHSHIHALPDKTELFPSGGLLLAESLVCAADFYPDGIILEIDHPPQLS